MNLSRHALHLVLLGAALCPLLAGTVVISDFASTPVGQTPMSWVTSGWAGNGSTVQTSIVAVRDAEKKATVLQAKADFSRSQDYWGFAIGSPGVVNPLLSAKGQGTLKITLWSATAGALTVRVASQDEDYRETGFLESRVTVESGKWATVEVPLAMGGGVTFRDDANHLAVSLIAGNGEGRPQNEPMEIRISDMRVDIR